ncbi:hypothetical protein [Ethanoligenens sp.]|uniref:hypothetical protein n=1 Tax=Ethanoligenens sp. TaxID=2099655 RepID=UPI0039ED2CEE
MFIKDLVGKYAIRTAPALGRDYSYMDMPVKVIYCDDFNAVVEPVEHCIDGWKSVLHVGWLDDEWRECPKEILNARFSRGHTEIEQKIKE